jgi:hypothetical protein
MHEIRLEVTDDLVKPAEMAGILPWSNISMNRQGPRSCAESSRFPGCGSSGVTHDADLVPRGLVACQEK